MNLNHACHMQLAAEDPAKAFGPKGVHVVVEGQDCYVRPECDRINVTLFGDTYPLRYETWAEAREWVAYLIKESVYP